MVGCWDVSSCLASSNMGAVACVAFRSGYRYFNNSFMRWLGSLISSRRISKFGCPGDEAVVNFPCTQIKTSADGMR